MTSGRREEKRRLTRVSVLGERVESERGAGESVGIWVRGNNLRRLTTSPHSAYRRLPARPRRCEETRDKMGSNSRRSSNLYSGIKGMPLLYTQVSHLHHLTAPPRQ